MTVRETILSDLKSAMKSGDTESRNTLRSLTAAIKQVEIDTGKSLDDAGVQAVVMKQAKQRRESMAEYERAGRDDLVAQEQRELAIIDRYVPQMMGRAEIATVARQTIDELGVTDMKGMGQVMGQLMGQLRGKADGRLVNDVVRELLQRVD